MNTKEKIIQELTDEKENFLSKDDLINEEFYSWHWNNNKSMLIIIGTDYNYELESSNETNLSLISERDIHDEYIFFSENSLFVVQGVGDDWETRIQIKTDIVISDRKWRILDTPNYTLKYKRINNVNVLVCF